MLVALDPGLASGAETFAARIERAFGSELVVFVAPAEKPDDGLEAVLGARPLVAIEGPMPPVWLMALATSRLRAGTPPDYDTLMAKIERATGKPQLAPGKQRRARLVPLSADALSARLATLDARWRLAVRPASGSPFGLRAELSADITCPDYAAAASFAFACAELAERQDHHPTLHHDWRTVRVQVSTGEALGRLTERDIEFAQAVDRLVDERVGAEP